MELARKIQIRLAQLEMTQSELAERIQADKSQISHWISGRNKPGMKNLSKIATALETTIDYFLEAPTSTAGIMPQGISEELLDRFPSINKGILVPLLGEISAGKMQEAIENTEKWDDAMYISGRIIEALNITHDHLYILKVRGASMLYEGIHEGDLILCEYLPYNRHEEYKPGNIIVAEYEGKVTLKKLFTKRVGINHVVIFLQAANPAYDPIIISDTAEQFHPLGKVRTVLRLFDKNHI